MKIDLATCCKVPSDKRIQSYPINPVTKRKYILKEKVYASLFDLNFKPDMVDIFIKWKTLPIINDALIIRPKTIWLQIGV